MSDEQTPGTSRRWHPKTLGLTVAEAVAAGALPVPLAKRGELNKPYPKVTVNQIELSPRGKTVLIGGGGDGVEVGGECPCCGANADKLRNIQVQETTERNFDADQVICALDGPGLKQLAPLNLGVLKCHAELKGVMPNLPEPASWYVNRWHNCTAYHVGSERNRPPVQSPIDNLLFIGDNVFVPQPAVFMEKTNVTAKWVTNLIPEKTGLAQHRIEILQSGTPSAIIKALAAVESVYV